MWGSAGLGGGEFDCLIDESSWRDVEAFSDLDEDLKAAGGYAREHLQSIGLVAPRSDRAACAAYVTRDAHVPEAQ